MSMQTTIRTAMKVITLRVEDGTLLTALLPVSFEWSSDDCSLDIKLRVNKTRRQDMIMR